MYDRSQFHKTSVKQLRAAAVEYSFTPGADMVTLMSDKASVLTQSLVVEEAVGTAKNTKKVAAVQKFRRPERAMYECVHSGLLTKRFTFNQPHVDVALENKSARMPDDAFRAKKKHRSLDFAAVVSTAQKSPFESPGAPSLCTRIIDDYYL